MFARFPGICDMELWCPLVPGSIYVIKFPKLARLLIGKIQQAALGSMDAKVSDLIGQIQKGALGNMDTKVSDLIGQIHAEGNTW